MSERGAFEFAEDTEIGTGTELPQPVGPEYKGPGPNFLTQLLRQVLVSHDG